MLVRLGNDHFGAFAYALDGVDTPDTQMADNDYALGRLIETVANSPFARDTLVIAIEDDACRGEGAVTHGAQRIDSLPTPVALLEENLFQRNCSLMLDHVHELGTRLRPPRTVVIFLRRTL